MGATAYLYFKNRYDQVARQHVLICFYSKSLSRCCQLLSSLHLLQICYWYII